MFKRILLATAVSMVVVSSAWSAPFHLALVGNATKTDINNRTTQLSPNGMGFGGGLLIGIPLSAKVQLELGGLLVHRKVTITTVAGRTPTTIDFDLKAIEFPMMFRFWLGNVFSVAVGPWFAKYSTADVSVKVGTARATTGSTNITGSDYGLAGGLAARVPLGAVVGILADFRYLQGFKAAKTHEMEGLLGLSFALGGK